MTAGGLWIIIHSPLCYLPMQKLEKILPSKSSELNAPVISPSEDAEPGANPGEQFAGPGHGQLGAAMFQRRAGGVLPDAGGVR